MPKAIRLSLLLLSFWSILGFIAPAAWNGARSLGGGANTVLAMDQITETVADTPTAGADTPTVAAKNTPTLAPPPTSTTVPPTAPPNPTATQPQPTSPAPTNTATTTIQPPTPTPPSPAPTQPASTSPAPSATQSLTPVTAPPSSTSEPPEEAFTLLKIEPDRISRESGGTLSIYGSGFRAGIAVRLVGYGLLDAALLNPTAIRAVVPPGLAEGRYGVEVIQSNGTSLRVNNAVRIRSSLPEPTDTPKPGTPVAVAKPELVVEAAESDPDPVRPGSTFTLRLQVVNHGGYTATGIRIALASTDQAVPREGSNLVVLEKLDSGQQATVELLLVLSQEAPSGYLSLPLSLEYSDYYLRDYTSQQDVGLNVGNAAGGQPLVLLRTYETRPASLSPGDAFTLHLELANVGGQPASQLLVTLGGQDNADSSHPNDTRPFAILGSGNVQFVPNLQAGEQYDLDLQLILDGSADSGVYNLPVGLAYEGPDQAAYNESQVVNLLVSRRPNLTVDYYAPAPVGQVGQTLELPIEVVNIGRNLVNVSTIQASGEGWQVLEGSAFVGALDGGTSGTLDAQVIPEKSGSLPILITVSYLDDFNQPQTIKQTLKVEVEQPAPTPTGPAQEGAEQPESFWDKLRRFFRGIFGLGS
jgi:hypothetical protein